MLTVIVGLSGALLFGSADFLGGLASKRISPLRVTAVAAVVGVIGLLAVTAVVGGNWSAQAILLGALSGVSGAVAISLLYACLAIGPMSILSPLTAVISAIVPMTAGWLRGERLSPIGYLAIVIALLAVALVAFAPEKNATLPSLKAVLMAIGSGLAIGMFMIIIDLTPADSGLVPLVLNRTVNAAIMVAAIGVIAWARRRRRGAQPGAEAGAPPVPAAASGASVRSVRPGASGLSGKTSSSVGGGWRAGLAPAIACGLIDALANALLLIGLRMGDLTVMSVLTALYPAGTIILAATLLRERIALTQGAGLALAVTAGALFTLA